MHRKGEKNTNQKSFSCVDSQNKTFHNDAKEAVYFYLA